MKLEDMIAVCVAAKTGNKEFALHLFPKDKDSPDIWQAAIGNPCVHVMLGESCGEVWANGATAEQAVREIAAKLGVVP